MDFANPPDFDEFERDADATVQRLRIEGRLSPMRALVARLLVETRAMNLGDTSTVLH